MVLVPEESTKSSKKNPPKRKGAGIFPLIEKGHQNLGGEGFEILEGVHYFTHFGKTRRREHLGVPNIPLAQEFQG